MRALPDGVLTLLFSDVEGSTRLAQGLGDQVWADCLEVHREVLARAFASHGGTVVDVEGDGFFVVFRRPTDAVLAAIEGQLALATQQWPSNCSIMVRMGVHTGEAVLRGEHYVGQEVHRASRICTAAHGGQIVLSQATVELVDSSMPDSVTLVDLGEHRLRDMNDPQRLYQLRAPLLRPNFPRLRTQPRAHAAGNYNAPLPKDAFVIEPGPDVPEALRFLRANCLTRAVQQIHEGCRSSMTL
jgi:class 3 adenylate cyclase